MAQQLDNEGFDTGSNYKFADKMIRPNFPRSAFDLSHLVTRDIPQAGLVFPISVIEALPASDYEISCKSLIRVLPQVVPLMSRQRLYLYAFYSRCSDLWCDFDVFIRKGYSGNEVLQVPSLQAINTIVEADVSGMTTAGNTVLPWSLGDCFGLPIGLADFGALRINAMPFMMYTRVWRDYFLNRNFYVDDRRILPNDDSRFRLLSDGKVASFVDAGDDIRFKFDLRGTFGTFVDTVSSPIVMRDSKGMQYVNLATGNIFVAGMFYHDYPADYFTSALPWPQRGNTPSLSVDFQFSDTGGFKYFNSPTNMKNIGRIAFPSVATGASSADGISQGDLIWSTLGTNSSNGVTTLLGAASSDGGVFTNAFVDWLNNSVVQSSSSVITLEALRDLAVSQTIMEKMARTDGSYREFGLTFFGEPSKSAMDYRPTFIGGTLASILFTEVLQTSSSTADSVLGQYAGHGISANSDGYLGRFHSDDYGYIMILGCIMPDVYYSQGLAKMWTRRDQSDWFLPERAQLGMQPILNKELYLQLQSVVDTDGHPVNDNLWAYQDIYDEYRYQNNRIGGQVAMSDKLSFYPYTQARKFTSLPNWGKEFARADDIRTDYLAAGNNESAYVAQFDVNIRAVQPLPYQARPASILNGVS